MLVKRLGSKVILKHTVSSVGVYLLNHLAPAHFYYCYLLEYFKLLLTF